MPTCEFGSASRTPRQWHSSYFGKKPTDGQLVGFHLSLLMGYVDSAPYFCMSTETIADMENVSMDGLHFALPQSLKALENAPALEEQALDLDKDK